MLRNVIENYLTEIKEVQFFVPFLALLNNLGYRKIRMLHGPYEFGKDIIAQKEDNSELIQYCFQLKARDINLNKFTSEIKPQILEIITNKVSHPDFNESVKMKCIFVTTGFLKPPATVSFQEFNNYLKNNCNENPVIIWEQGDLVNYFIDVGIEPFFSLHQSPEFVAKFYDLLAKTKNDDHLSSFDIVRYTDNWLNIDLSNGINILQILFEGYLFSKVLCEHNNYYEGVLFLSAALRALMKDKDARDKYKDYVFSTIEDILSRYEEYFDEKLRRDRSSALAIDTAFALFNYPIECCRILELLSIKVLISKTKSEKAEKLIDELLKEQGACRPISDNYAASIFLITTVLIKRGLIDAVKKYLNNIAVWLCDRYENNGLASIGSELGAEYEQIMSEYLSGLDFEKRRTSYLAKNILDLCVIINDQELFTNITNDFKAVNIIPEFFCLVSEGDLFDYKNVITQYVEDTSLKFDNYRNEIIKSTDHNMVPNITDKEAIILTYLLRDRCFPERFHLKEIL